MKKTINNGDHKIEKKKIWKLCEVNFVDSLMSNVITDSPITITLLNTWKNSRCIGDNKKVQWTYIKKDNFSNEKSL